MLVGMTVNTTFIIDLSLALCLYVLLSHVYVYMIHFMAIV